VTGDQDRLARRRSRGLREILSERRITTVYQPIVDLRARRVIGYEALSRGPDGEFVTPDVLFRVAYEAELVAKLDAVCREQAVLELGHLGDDQLLFINMEPQSIFDPRLASAIPPKHVGQVVFEITEHAAIADFATFRQAVHLLRQSGFHFAMDDVGSAYSGLRIVAGIVPDFIKLDMELTRGAQDQRVKMELVRAIANFCTETGVPLVAEGIETPEELNGVLDVGVHLVQGYLLGKPASALGKEEVHWPAAGIPVGARAGYR
jgi:EAL domain-containing protein (putative c-di-GMP-specific phosphodiesterase class I)